MKNIKVKNLISISIAGSFLIVSITGLLMYFLKHESLTSSLHTIFGFLFLGYAVFHIRNNWKVLKSYSLPKPGNIQRSKIKQELWVGTGILLLLFTAVSFKLAPIQYIYDWGNTFRTGQRNSLGDQITYRRFQFNPEGKGNTLQIDLRKGPYFEWPTYAFWLEDTAGNYLQTLYVTGKLANNNFFTKVVRENGEDIFVDEPESAHLRERPEALPVWAHQYGSRSDNGNFVPSGNEVVVDGYSGATITDNFLLQTKADRELPDQFVVKFEINHSFDWNAYYTPDRFPEDPIYSGNGRVGQPSVVYSTIVDRTLAQKFYVLELIGRGHHSGQDGQVYSDLAEITTARELVDRVIVEVLN